MMLQSVFLLFCALLVQGQLQYLTSPTPLPSCPGRLGENDTISATPYRVEVGGFFTVTWNTNGQNSDNSVYLYLYHLNGSRYLSIGRNETFNAATTYVRIPPQTMVGEYILRWQWQGNINCTYLELTPDPLNSIKMYAGETVSGLVSTDPQYFEVNVTGRNFIYLEVTGPTDQTAPNGYANVYAKEGLRPPYPGPNVYDERLSTQQDGLVVFGLCNDNGGDTGYRVVVQGASGATNTSAFTITPYFYDGLINVGTLFTGTPHHGFRYFRTQAFAKFEDPRRIVLQADEEWDTVPEFYLANDCENNGIIRGEQTGGSTHCIQMGERQGNKYITVSAMTSGYTLIVENGDCSETGAAGMIQVSSLLLMAVLMYFFM